jgi:hypothetical protein
MAEMEAMEPMEASGETVVLAAALTAVGSF